MLMHTYSSMLILLPFQLEVPQIASRIYSPANRKDEEHVQFPGHISLMRCCQSQLLAFNLYMLTQTLE